MNRRHFLSAAIITALSSALLPAPAAALDMIEYKPGLIKQYLAEGKTIFVDYATDWCSTCARQERVISELRSENPGYDKSLIFVRVDWDAYSGHEVSKSRKIPRRSTLLVLKGDQELGRIVAGTSKDQIKQLMDTGVQAGS